MRSRVEVDPSISPKPNTAPGKFLAHLAPAAALMLAASCSFGGGDSSTQSEATPTATAPSEATADCEKRPAKNPAYDIASGAAWTAYQDNEFQAAANLLDQIQDQEIRAATYHSIEFSKGEEAVVLGGGEDNFAETELEEAEALIDTIEISDIRALSERALDFGEATIAAEAVHDGDMAKATYALGFIEDPKILADARQAVTAAQQGPEGAGTGLLTMLRGQYIDSAHVLHEGAVNEWAALHEQSSGYCHPI